ncbi:MAG: phosphoribosyltransferase family protein, partial [Chitinivibrionales bacterium]|nr:phosphoribosyltransferase family protein [Chitinivibrionales bacterium]
SIIHQIKYGGKTRLAFDMGRRFGTLVPVEFLENVDCIIPVPLHYWRRLKRGYNQAEHLALGLLQSWDKHVAYLPGALRRTRTTKTQTKLTREIRKRNLIGAFNVPQKAAAVIKGRQCLLIDDVITTGATVNACAAALLKSGAAGVKVFSLARD